MNSDCDTAVDEAARFSSNRTLRGELCSDVGLGASVYHTFVITIAAE